MLRRSTRQSLQGTRKRSASPSANDKKNKNPRASVSTYERTNLKTQRAPSDKSNLDQGEAATGTEMASGDESESINDNISEFSAAPSGDSAEESPSDLSDGDDYDSQQTKRGRKSFPKGVARNQIVEARGSRELWREGVRTGAPPGTQVIIKKPKARPAGKTPYSECTIHPNTMLFLSDLKDNNQREWLKMHDPDYRASLSDWNTFIEVVTQKLCEIDDTIPELPVKDITYRIHRDIRFSPDKTPYKTYFSAAWSRTGRKGPYAHYYVQISPGDNSFIGGGLWYPEASSLAKLRRDIDRHPQRLKDALMGEGMRKEMLGNAPRNTAKVVQAFVSSRTNAESALKTKPKGYEHTHRDIDLLRLRNFTIGRRIQDSEILDGYGFLGQVTKLFAIIHPFILCLNRIVLPDPSDEAEDDDEEEQSETSSAVIESDTRSDVRVGGSP